MCLLVLPQCVRRQGRRDDGFDLRSAEHSLPDATYFAFPSDRGGGAGNQQQVAASLGDQSFKPRVKARGEGRIGWLRLSYVVHFRYEMRRRRLETRTRPLQPVFLLLVSFLQVAAGFVERALGVVVGLQGLAVFVGSALALAGDVEDFAELDMAPDLGPARLAVAIERFPVGVGRGLVIPLLEEHLGDTVVRERAV